MKKILIFLILLAMIISPFGAVAQTASGQQNVAEMLVKIKQLQEQIKQLQEQRQEAVAQLITSLRQGARGDQVKILQAILAADLEIYPEGIISGFFGSATNRAVKRFQKKHGIKSVGNVGPKTLHKINELLKENPIAFETSTSTGVVASATSTEARPCAIVPPGHLIAPGWLRKHGGVRPIVPACQILPPGIIAKLGLATSTPPHATSTPDTIAPIMTNISAVASSTSVIIAWTTNEPATGKVYYSTTTPIDILSASTLYQTDVNLVTNHSISLSGLNATTTYFYVVESKDAFNNTATSSQQSFTTL